MPRLLGKENVERIRVIFTWRFTRNLTTGLCLEVMYHGELKIEEDAKNMKLLGVFRRVDGPKGI
jgi:hypothetical protein